MMNISKFLYLLCNYMRGQLLRILYKSSICKPLNVYMQLVDKGTKYAAERRVDVSYKFNKKKLLRKKKNHRTNRERIDIGHL